MLKNILIGMLVILLLPLVAYGLLYAYGMYIVTKGGYKQEQLNEEQEVRSSSGNGYGGDEGFKIVDSGINPKKYFWLDNDHIVLMGKRNKDFINYDHFVWNIETNKFKPIKMSGGMACFDSGYMFHFYNPDPFDKDDIPRQEQIKYYRSKMREDADEWSLFYTENIRDIWPLPSDDYELRLSSRDCQPRFVLIDEEKEKSSFVRLRLRYLNKFGWIVKYPDDADENILAESGIYNIDEEVYAENLTVEELITKLPEIPINEYSGLEFHYVDFINKYLLVNRVTNPDEKTRILQLLSQDGKYQYIDWPKKWDDYESVPMLTRKGFVWSSLNFKLKNPKYSNYAGFISVGNSVHKFIHGPVVGQKISPNGCYSAFINQPKIPGKSYLRIFDICNSTLNGKKLEDVVY